MRGYGAEVSTIGLVLLLLASTMKGQEVSEAVFDRQWGGWRITVAGDRVVVSCHQASLLVLTPFKDTSFRSGQWQGSTVTLRFQGNGGESLWIFGITPNALNLVVQHTLPTPASSTVSWRWVTVNPNLMRGASAPSKEEWIASTIFGSVALSVGGAGAQKTQWRRTEIGWRAELVYPQGVNVLYAQLELRVPPHWLVAEPPRGDAVIHPIDLVQGEFWDLPLLPRPQWWRWGDAPFRLGRQVLVLVANDTFRPAAEHLRAYLQSHWLRQVTLRAWSPDMPLERGIVLAPHRSPLRERAAALEPRLKPDLPPEGYVLTASPEGVWILAADKDGAFWAVQTLKQLLYLTDDGALIVPGIFLRDFPDFPFRGVHIVLDDSSPELHGRLIEQVWAPLKFNKLVMQVDHLKWERHPELWQPWSLPKEAAKELQRRAEANNMEVIPLLPTLSHCEYLFGTVAGRPARTNVDIAEDPDAAYAYCPNSERTYQLVFDLLDEVLTLFNPRFLHIGHDEVLNRGRFGSCIRCQGMPLHQLFAADVQRLSEFLKKRGVGVMMWGDMLLRPDEAFDAAHGGEPHNFWRARTLLPRDIVIVDWHYQPAPRYPSVKVFRKEGFTVIGATWRNLDNIVGFSQAAKAAGAWGMLQTTWTGFGNNRNALKDFPDQFAAYIVAADQFWSTSASALSRGYSAWSVFETLWRGPTVPPMSGFIVDLSPIANLPLAKLVGASPQHLRGHKRWWNRRLFWLAADEEGTLKAVALRSVWLAGAPEEVRLPIEEPATELTFIHATGFAAPEEAIVGGYELRLEDGETVTVPLYYGRQVRAVTDERPLRDPRASPAWRLTTPKGSIHLTAFTLPLEGERVVRQIRFYAAHEEAMPLLVAVTGVTAKPVVKEAP